jgi:hypothetical protein
MKVFHLSQRGKAAAQGETYSRKKKQKLIIMPIAL